MSNRYSWSDLFDAAIAVERTNEMLTVYEYADRMDAILKKKEVK